MTVPAPIDWEKLGQYLHALENMVRDGEFSVELFVPLLFRVRWRAGDRQFGWKKVYSRKAFNAMRGPMDAVASVDAGDLLEATRAREFG